MKKPDKYENLRKLAKLLDVVPVTSFNIGYWGKIIKISDNECGFAGCACGWATHVGLIPGFT